MDKVRCPYCGSTMGLWVDSYSDGTVGGAFYTCPDCKSDSPYIEYAEDIEAAARAAAMQRRQEPNRVLTAEEVEHAWKSNVDRLALAPMWYEARRGCVNNWVMVHRYALDESNMASYGKGWRAWLRRPTDEERKAVRWEDD